MQSDPLGGQKLFLNLWNLMFLVASMLDAFATDVAICNSFNCQVGWVRKDAPAEGGGNGDGGKIHEMGAKLDHLTVCSN